MDDDQKAAYQLCVGLYGNCLCQSRQSEPCDWMADAVQNDMTVAKVRREMTMCRNAIQEFEV